jgi:ADP-ribosylglycohydrolase
LIVRVRGAPGSPWRTTALHISPQSVTLAVEDVTITAPRARYPNGEVDDYMSFAALARDARSRGVALEACASCVRFRFSGLSQQFSGGTEGYCTMVGWRSQRAVVRIDHYCGEHELVEGWPDDLERAARARLDLSARDPQPSRANAFAGSILGLAIGDALGFPTEFRARAQILGAFGPQGVTDLVSVDDPRWHEARAAAGPRFPPGTYSDDTQMTLAVAEALIEAGRADLDTLMRATARRFAEWSTSADNNRAPGNTCMNGCRNLERGTAWRLAGIRDSKGSGSAMRVGPIGLYYWRDHARLLEVARASSLLTHGHDAAVESAAAGALLVALALEKRTPSQMLATVREHCASRSSDLRSRLDDLERLLTAPPEIALSARGLGEGWVAEEAIVSALYCLFQNPDDFEQCVLMAANTDGDSDTIACIVGGISGAFHGLSAIPQRWRTRVENAVQLHETAERLWQASAGSHDTH